ncbi:hypothetical protein SKAU_G00216320 [Synaphobranchus kaupii]|uniref:Uncharacterized protein n=1 Tax=Synaphobranchus kaupii TaxID=118154 RepID=A0A9Q1FA40_SYNKA|nr:hypothetical protein SKAU_G00216320 [Synaphobranchus kaupii]
MGKVRPAVRTTQRAERGGGAAGAMGAAAEESSYPRGTRRRASVLCSACRRNACPPLMRVVAPPHLETHLATIADTRDITRSIVTPQAVAHPERTD